MKRETRLGLIRRSSISFQRTLLRTITFHEVRGYVSRMEHQSNIEVTEEAEKALQEYATVPIALQVKSMLDVTKTMFQNRLGERDNSILLCGLRKSGTVPDGFETASSSVTTVR